MKMSPKPSCQNGVLAVSEDSELVACTVFKDRAQRQGWNYQWTDKVYEATKLLRDYPKWGSKRTIVLFCLDDPDVKTIPGEFRKVRKHTRTILYARKEHSSGQLAIQCVHEEKALDYLVGPDHDALLSRQFDAVLRIDAGRKRRAVAREESDLRLRKHSRVFGVLPYTPQGSLSDWETGVKPALDAVGLNGFLATDRLESHLLFTQVTTHINKSSAVFANITQYDGRDNPNVYFEIGYAMGKGIPCLLLRQISEAALPIDLKGHMLCEYINDCDLALQLYRRLKRLAK